MKYAIIKDGSKQYKVSVGDQLLIELSSQSVGSQIKFDQVLMTVDGESIQVGAPTVGDIVTAKVLEHTKGKKVRVATYKAKSRWRTVNGHRHQYTKVEITGIGASTKETKAEKPAATKPVAAKKAAPKKAAVKKTN